MMHRSQLTEEHVQRVIDYGELPDEVLKERSNVAVILTQGWCPQWKAMDVWLTAAQNNAEPQEYELSVRCFVYDKSPLFKQFRRFKEKTWGNHHVPYVRYYKDGKLVDETNYVPAQEFFSRFASPEHTASAAPDPIMEV